MTRWYVTLVPLVVCIVVAIVVALGGGNGTIRFGVPLATALVVAGALVSGAWLAGSALRRGQRRAVASARDAGVAEERDAHRRFLDRLDHELKNPVTAIRAALAAETQGAAAPSANIAIATSQTTRLVSLVGDLRALASLENRDIERVPVDVQEIATEEVDALREELAARGAMRDLVLVFPAAPWPLPAVAGDADLVGVAVRNLLVNAAKYSDEGARIEVRGADDGAFVSLEVADTGWGIGAEDLAHVWDELWRGADARRVEGSGLGLSLVRVVAERHGGDVAIRSQPGRGTSVRLRLPVVRRP